MTDAELAAIRRQCEETLAESERFQEVGTDSIDLHTQDLLTADAYAAADARKMLRLVEEVERLRAVLAVEREECAAILDEKAQKAERERDRCVKASDAEWEKPSPDRHRANSYTTDASCYTAEALTLRQGAAAIRSRS